MPLHKWINPPETFKESPDSLIIEALAGTDFFIDIQGEYQKKNAHLYLAEIEGDFVLTCRVEPHFKTTYDAGGLFIRLDDEHWVKYAFEMTDLGYQSVVSIVTDKISDDCNGERIEADRVWLRICRKDDCWALHHSEDGVVWKMSRYFRLEFPAKISTGLIAQSPIGEGCRVVFNDLSIEDIRVKDLRKGV